MSRAVTHDGLHTLQVRFPFDRALVDLVKTLPHRRWNASERFWSVPETDVVAVVDLLMTRGFEFDRATCELYRSMGGSAELLPGSARRTDSPAPGLFDAPVSGDLFPADDPRIEPRNGSDDYTVSRLNERVRDLLQQAFPGPVWLVGEISGFNKSAHRRHVSFELVERSDDGGAVSRLPTTLFASTREAIERALRDAGDPFKLEDEIQVRAHVSIGLYVPWGQYRAVVEELDLGYTLGEAARRREEIVRRLARAGLLERNSELPLPTLPLRLGLITSLGSDAYNDVLRTLQDSGFAFRVTAHGARVQGHATEASVLNALDWFRARRERFDMILICRGGGARTDLVWFDSEALGRAVAEFPLPVVVGIGHEQDHSVLDAVARSCKTPTAAAGLAVDRVRQSLERLESSVAAVLQAAARMLREERQQGLERGRRLALAARGTLRHERAALDHRRARAVLGTRAVLAGARHRLTRWSALLPLGTRRHLQQQAQRLANLMRAVDQGTRRDLRAARQQLEAALRGLAPRSRAVMRLELERVAQRERRLDLVHPRRVVERGYAILRSEDGRVLTRAAAAATGASLRAELRYGILKLRSEGVEST